MPPSRAPSRLGRLPTLPRRVATLSLHTSPLALPGTGDAGGMNVYVVELAKQLAVAGVESDIFTRATSSELPPAVELVPGVTVRHVPAGPYDGLGKEALPARLGALGTGVLRAAGALPAHYDLVHSHYWLSGQVGRLAAERWGVPLVHSMHTMARVKNALLAHGDLREPAIREIGEQQVVDAADRLVASTAAEAAELVALYGADPSRVATVAPGVDLDTYRPGDRTAARHRLGLPADAVVLVFVGRLQPLKAPDLLLRAAARLVAADPALRGRLVVAVVGGPSGTGRADPMHLPRLAGELGIADLLRFEPPVAAVLLADWYRAATVCVVPSRSESFGLVALEAQACGTPVVAAAVGGLPTVVRDGVTGLLVARPDAAAYADAIARLLAAPDLREVGLAGAAHAAGFSWAATARAVLDTYGRALIDRGPALAATR